MTNTEDVVEEILIRAIKEGRLFSRTRSFGGWFIPGNAVEDRVRVIVKLLFDNKQVAESLQSLNLEKIIFNALIASERLQSLQDRADLIAGLIKKRYGSGGK